MFKKKEFLLILWQTEVRFENLHLPDRRRKEISMEMSAWVFNEKL